jgi:hypothetical protein
MYWLGVFYGDYHMKKYIIRAMLVAIMVQSISLGAVAPELSYKDKIKVVLQLKIAQVKRGYNDFKQWLCKEDVQAGIKKVAMGSAALIGSYVLWLYYSNPFVQIIPVGNVQPPRGQDIPVGNPPEIQDVLIGNANCNGLQRAIDTNVEVIQLESAEQFGWDGQHGQTCPHYAIYFDALLHNQLINPRIDFAQRLIDNVAFGQQIRVWRELVIHQRDALGRDLLGRGDFLDGEEIPVLIHQIQQSQPEFYAAGYNYAVVDSIQQLNAIEGVDPTVDIVRDLAQNQNYTAGIIVNNGLQLHGNEGLMRGYNGHWFVIRVVKRDGVLSFYIMDSMNHVRLDDYTVHIVIAHLRGV